MKGWPARLAEGLYGHDPEGGAIWPIQHPPPQHVVHCVPALGGQDLVQATQCWGWRHARNPEQCARAEVQSASRVLQLGPQGKSVLEIPLFLRTVRAHESKRNKSATMAVTIPAPSDL